MTLLDMGMVSYGMCKFTKVEVQDQRPELLELASLAAWKVCSAQCTGWWQSKCFLSHVPSLEHLHDVVVMLSSVQHAVQMCTAL